MYAMGGSRAALEQKYDAALQAALRVAGTRGLPAGWTPRLPPALRETMAGLAALEGPAAPEGRVPEAASAFYCERMPQMLVEQRLRGEDPARRLLWRPLALTRLPRLDAALRGLFAALGDEGLDAGAMLGARDPEALIALRPSAAALAAGTVLGSGLPLVGAYPAERALLNLDLSTQDPDAALDHRLSGNLIHELAHGPLRELSSPPPPWLLLESAAVLLGALAFPRHIFPDQPGEAVAGVSLFALAGHCFARLFGRRALLSLVAEAAPLEQAFGPRAARLLATAGWQEFLARGEPPFARDALRAVAWVKLADLSRAGETPGPARPQEGPDLLAAADALPWAALPWWSEPPSPADLTLARESVLPLFQRNVLAPNFQTHPAEAPQGRLALDTTTCLLSCQPRPEGAFGEPARWLYPPNLCRLLRQRGARAVVVEGARRAQAAAIADALLELALGQRPLGQTEVLAWTSSPRS